MKVRNINPHVDGVYLSATDQDVPVNGVIDVDDELGVALCAQVDNWQEVKSAKAAAKDGDN